MAGHDPDEVDFPWIEKSLLTSDTLCVHTNAGIVDVIVEGIRRITADAIAAATAEGRVLTLHAVVDKPDDGVSARVYPALI